MYNMAYLAQHPNVLLTSRCSIILAEFSAVARQPPGFLREKEKTNISDLME